MSELPIFPLNTVLFPGMPLGLHIFEPRYRLMIKMCLEKKSPFGVVLIKEGQEALGPIARPHPIGCSANISRVEELDDGRWNIMVTGQERFRILTLNHDKPYLVGEIELLPMPAGDEVAARQAARHLASLVLRYITMLSRSGGAENETFGLPEDPLALGFLAATVLQVPSERQQRLLAAADTVALLVAARQLYRQELPLLQLIVAEDPADNKGSFSLN